MTIVGCAANTYVPESVEFGRLEQPNDTGSDCKSLLKSPKDIWDSLKNPPFTRTGDFGVYGVMYG